MVLDICKESEKQAGLAAAVDMLKVQVIEIIRQ